MLAVAEGVRRDAGPQPRPAWRALTERTSLWNQLLRLAFRIRCPIPTRPGAWQYKRSPRSGGVASFAVPSLRGFGAVVGVKLVEIGHERPGFASPGLLAPTPLAGPRAVYGPPRGRCSGCSSCGAPAAAGGP